MPLSHVALVINAALFDSIWEGALIVGLVWLGLRCLRQLSAASRYTIWLSALAALIAIPVFTAVLSERIAAPRAAATAAELRQPIPASASQPDSADLQGQRSLSPATKTLPAGLEQALTGPRLLQIRIPQGWVLTIAMVWALVVIGRMFRLAVDLREIAAIRREGNVWSKAYDFPVYISNRVRLPIAIGFLQPAVVLPASILDQLDERALDAILIHEIAHLHRYDMWTNALAQVVAALLALNPVSWFVARQISIEREIACDDWVVARSSSSDAFARALVVMASGVGTAALAAAPSALGSRRAIIVRIERLVDDMRPRSLRFSKAALAGTLTLLTLMAFTLQAVSPVLAFSAKTTLATQSLPVALASSCKQRDIGPLLHHSFGPGGPRMISESLDAAVLQKLVRAHPATTTTYEVSVDAAGHPHNFTILHPSNSPAQDQRLARSVLSSTFAPARHNCAAIAATFRSGITQLPQPSVLVVTTQMKSEVDSAATKVKNSCVVPHRHPEIIHEVRPNLSDSMKALVAQRTFVNAVRVRVDAAGTITSAVIASSSGQTDFDDAALVAAKRSSYAPGIVNCKAAPSDYIELSAFTKWLEP